jgi:hypothetical protein
MQRPILVCALAYAFTACGMVAAEPILGVEAGVDAQPTGGDSGRLDSTPADSAPVDEDGAVEDPSPGGGGGCTKSDVCSKRVSANQTCVSAPTAAPGVCPAGYSGGPCPSTDLVGCCVLTPVEGGASRATATCYYTADAGSRARGNCITNMYEGFPYQWEPKPPCE